MMKLSNTMKVVHFIDWQKLYYLQVEAEKENVKSSWTIDDLKKKRKSIEVLEYNHIFLDKESRDFHPIHANFFTAIVKRFSKNGNDLCRYFETFIILGMSTNQRTKFYETIFPITC